MVWITWGVVAVGVGLVIVALFLLAERLRPLRRAVRKLGWHRDDLVKLQAGTEELAAQLTELAAASAQARAARTAAREDDTDETARTMGSTR